MANAIDPDAILKALHGEHRLSLNTKLLTGYIALMLAATAASFALPLGVALIRPFEALHPVVASESFATWANVAIWVSSAVVAYVFATAVYVVDDAGIHKRQLVGGWSLPRGDIAEVTVDPGTFNSHLELTLRDGRKKAFIMTPSMVRALEAKERRAPE